MRGQARDARARAYGAVRIRTPAAEADDGPERRRVQLRGQVDGADEHVETRSVFADRIAIEPGQTIAAMRDVARDLHFVSDRGIAAGVGDPLSAALQLADLDAFRDGVLSGALPPLGRIEAWATNGRAVKGIRLTRENRPSLRQGESGGTDKPCSEALSVASLLGMAPLTSSADYACQGHPAKRPFVTCSRKTCPA